MLKRSLLVSVVFAASIKLPANASTCVLHGDGRAND